MKIQLISNPANHREELIAKFQHMVLSYAKRYKNKFSVEDLFQEGFMTLMACVDAKGDALTAPYAATAIKRSMQKMIQAECDEPSEYMGEIEDTVSNPGLDAADQHTPKVEYDNKQVTEADMYKLFAKALTEREAEVLSLRWIGGHSIPEVARFMDIGESTAQRAEVSAIEKLSHCFEYSTLTKELWRMVLLQSIANGDSSDDHLRKCCERCSADYETMKKMTPEGVRLLLSSLRKAGLK
jgi:RNA polymerase sigma factor (sigma-70 family)